MGKRVQLGIETFGSDDDPLVLLVGGPTMLSWPDSVCERLVSAGRRVVRYDLRDCGASTTLDPQAPAYSLRDLAADAAALVGTLGAARAHLGGVGVGGMVAQVAALDHPDAFSALILVSSRPVAPGPVCGRRDAALFPTDATGTRAPASDVAPGKHRPVN